MTDAEWNERCNERLGRIENILERYVNAKRAASDARTFAPVERSTEGVDFFEQMRRYHRQNPQEVKAEENAPEHTAQDSARGGEIEFFASSRRLHRLNPTETKREIEKICRPSLRRER